MLGIFSSLVKTFPKAGHWLIVFKRIFGVILTGFGIFYLTLVLHLQLPGTSKAEIVWAPYSTQAVAGSVAQHKPVIIDFYADWCISCHELDMQVFSNPQIIKQLKKVTTLRVNATNMDDPKVQDIISRYDVIGLPTVVFLDSKGNEIQDARVTGLTAVKEFSKSLTRLLKGEGR